MLNYAPVATIFSYTYTLVDPSSLRLQLLFNWKYLPVEPCISNYVHESKCSCQIAPIIELKYLKTAIHVH